MILHAWFCKRKQCKCECPCHIPAPSPKKKERKEKPARVRPWTRRGITVSIQGPYSDPEVRRTYQREYKRAYRLKGLNTMRAENVCPVCRRKYNKWEAHVRLTVHREIEEALHE